MGTPDELYDEPANSFVMSFLGPVTVVGGQLVRPHDLAVFDEPEDGTTPATVNRVARLGFEVRVELSLADGREAYVQVTRSTVNRFALAPGRVVHVRPALGAVTMPAPAGPVGAVDGLEPVTQPA